MLRKLIMSSNYNHPIKFLPISLTKIVFGYMFNQPILFLKNLHNLRYLTFGACFNQKICSSTESLNGDSINKTKLEIQSYLPPNLKHLHFDEHFNQVIDPIANLVHLTHLSFGYDFNQSINPIRDLLKLKELVFGFEFDQPIVDLPHSITHLRIGSKALSKVINLPKSLEKLTLPRYKNNGIPLNEYIRSRKDFAIEAGWLHSREKS